MVENMTTTKQDIDHYLRIHTKIVDRFLAKARATDPRMVDLLKERGPWEAWLRRVVPKALDTIVRERKLANELWAGGREENCMQFRLSVETEYELATWAIARYLNNMDTQARELAALTIKEVPYNQGMRY
jgi:hypothetical protein